MKVIKCIHLTQTEIRSIKQMLQMGLTSARNKTNTKTYEVIQGTPNKQGYEYKIKIGSYITAWCELRPTWQYQTVTIQHITKPILNDINLF